jgi:hypothetical protein
MNDDELVVTVRESVRAAHLDIPVEQIVHRSRAIRARRRIPPLAGGLGAVVAAAALILTAGPGPTVGPHEAARHARTVVTADWTVREAADGTVTIDMQQYADPAGLERTLRADGINAIVRAVPSQTRRLGKGIMTYLTCGYADATNVAPPAVQRAVWTVEGQVLPVRFIIRPDAMPRGSALFLAFLSGMPRSPKNGNTGVTASLPIVLTSDTVPACVPKPVSIFR